MSSCLMPLSRFRFKCIFQCPLTFHGLTFQWVARRESAWQYQLPDYHGQRATVGCGDNGNAGLNV